MMEEIRVKNITNNGREVPNQFLICYNEDGCQYYIFQSYESMICKWKNGKLVEVGSDWDASITTGKYRNKVTGMTKKEFEKFLKNNYEWNEDTQSFTLKKII